MRSSQGVNWLFLNTSFLVSIFKKKHIFLLTFFFLERGRERGGPRERNIDEKELWLAASCMPLAGDEPTTQACALSENQTRDLLVYRSMLSHWATPAGLLFPSCLVLCTIDLVAVVVGSGWEGWWLPHIVRLPGQVAWWSVCDRSNICCGAPVAKRRLAFVRCHLTAPHGEAHLRGGTFSPEIFLR